MPLLEFTDKGIFCPQGNFYIDPWENVDYAVITHAHADHARKGMKYYLAHHWSIPILYLRLGKINAQGVEYGETIYRNGVRVTLFPAGHIPGSSQVLVEYKGERWVVSGDYKLENDEICIPFEPVKCHVFVTESTFGLPIYQWKPQQVIFEEINRWWQYNRANGKTSILLGYALGKAQRLLKNLNPAFGRIGVHGSVWNVIENSPFIKYEYPIEKVSPSQPKGYWDGAMIVAPPSADGSRWLKKFQPYQTAFVSGWMSIRGIRRRKATDAGFALSDHADWNGLLRAIRATEAQEIYVTHGYAHVLGRYLQSLGLKASAVKTEFEGESLHILPNEETENVEMS
ncbi:MAG: ligase-associated DNA damage response exonuclease [Cytophagales bacterium]|nr:ligase-associated DNA damage response exonuclease [Cytophagales bacterium]MDW8383443.1 ligase-associated DNA damage response exonuclease [Flammeovirgaceae bacterium]